MGYTPEPPPELSDLGDRHRLQRHAYSSGYVAVPETVWRQLVTLTSGLVNYLDGNLGGMGMEEWNRRVALWEIAVPAHAAAKEADERIRQEKE